MGSAPKSPFPRPPSHPHRHIDSAWNEGRKRKKTTGGLKNELWNYKRRSSEGLEILVRGVEIRVQEGLFPY
jgi:hypothetical protein